MKKQTTKQTWYWVVGNFKSGFKVVTRQPRGKNVSEPFTSMVLAQLEIANIYSQNS